MYCVLCCEKVSLYDIQTFIIQLLYFSIANGCHIINSFDSHRAATIQFNQCERSAFIQQQQQQRFAGDCCRLCSIQCFRTTSNVSKLISKKTRASSSMGVGAMETYHNPVSWAYFTISRRKEKEMIAKLDQDIEYMHHPPRICSSLSFMLYA